MNDTSQADAHTAITDLPFVEDSGPPAPGWPHRNFWAVEPESDDYDEQYRQGERYALAALEYMADASPGFGLLFDVAAGMPCRTDATGVEAGFWGCISAYAKQAMRDHGDKGYRAHMKRSEKLMREIEEQEKRSRSVRGRKAAQARWAKHRAGKKDGADTFAQSSTAEEVRAQS